MTRRTLGLLPLLLAACGPPAPVAYPGHTQAWLGSRKKTLKAGEEALRAAMAAPGVKLVPAPGNDEPVMVSQGGEGQPACLTGAWFTLDGPPAAWLGETYQYAWHLCVGDEPTYLVEVNCLEVKKTEHSVESHECAGGRIAREVARRTDALIAGLATQK